MEKMSLKRWLYLFSVLTFALIFANVGINTNIVNKLISASMPFIIGIILAYILYLPEKKIECFFNKFKNSFFKKHKRGLAIISIYLIVFLLIYVFAKILSPVISNSSKELIKNIPEYYKKLEESSIFDSNIGNYVLSYIENIDIKSFLSIESIFKYLKNTIGAAKELFNVFVSLIVSVYLLLDRNRLLTFWDKEARANLSKNNYISLCNYTKKANTIFASYLSGQIIDALIVGILSIIILSVLKVRYSVLLGMIIGFSNLIPFFGSIFGIGFVLIIIVLTGGFNKLIISGLLIFLLQQIDANIINPKITSTQVDISPIVTITSVTIGGAIFGILGMLLAVPVSAIIKTILEDKANNKLKIN